MNRGACSDTISFHFAICWVYFSYFLDVTGQSPYLWASEPSAPCRAVRLPVGDSLPVDRLVRSGLPPDDPVLVLVRTSWVFEATSRPSQTAPTASSESLSAVSSSSPLPGGRRECPSVGGWLNLLPHLNTPMWKGIQKMWVCFLNENYLGFYPENIF